MGDDARKLWIACLTPPDLVDAEELGLEQLLGPHELRFLPRDQEAVAPALGEADFLLGDWTGELKVGPAELEGASRCRMIVQPAAGYDSIDVETAAQLDVPVLNAPGANSHAVAEWTVMAVLAVLRDVVKNHRRTAEGTWAMSTATREGIRDLRGEEVGFLGFGATAQQAARLMDAFAPARFHYFRRSSSAELPEISTPLLQAATVDELCARSSVLCLHVPLTAETQGYIGARQLALLGENGVLVNVARGGVVDEEALAAALVSGVIRSAALDVFEGEPLDAGHCWGSVPNVLLSPHLAGSSAGARRAMLLMAFERIAEAAAGVLPVEAVNGVDRLRGFPCEFYFSAK